MRIAVVGAGAFGGWTALHLLRRGARVTLLDAWGPGHSRASSGGETRVTRAVYGPDAIYVDWVARSFPQWREFEAQVGQRFYHRTGALWLCTLGEDYVESAAPLLAAAGLPLQELPLAAARERYPMIDLAGVKSVWLEPEAGYLFARRACQAVQERFVREGGDYRQLAVAPGAIDGGRMPRVALSDGSTLEADLFVFACGPWLGELFPETFGEAGLRPSRQEIFFFGLPAGDSRFAEGVCPIWFDLDERIVYGIPGNEHRGFKVADDTRGTPIDPTTADRTPTPEFVARARTFLARRFPGMAGAPLVESRVCQYENSLDGQLYVDRHPRAENVWLLGGGSGHGFKLGPPLGAYMAELLLDGRRPEPMFSLARLAAPAGEFRTQFAFETDPSV
jgi:glycine/D-amino acid oxidase-like deaminating enzyme